MIAVPACSPTGAADERISIGSVHLTHSSVLPTDRSLLVVLLATGSAISGNDMGATLFLFAVGFIGLATAYRERRGRTTADRVDE